MAQFTNQAQLRYGNAVTSSNIVVGEITEVLSITKTALGDAYGQNDNITYVVSITNAGTIPFSGITVTDNLGSYTFGSASLTPLDYVPGSLRLYVNGVLQPTPTVTAGPPMSITDVNIPAGGNAILIYETTTNSYAPLGTIGTIDNTVTATGIGITPVSATETMAAVNAPVLSITKSVSPVPVTENSILTYTFLIQNTGNTPADAATDIIITDTFQPVLSNISVSLNGTALTTPADYTYNTTTGDFATVAGQITVPAASYTQSASTGAYVISPGVSTLTVSGRV